MYILKILYCVVRNLYQIRVVCVLSLFQRLTSKTADAIATTVYDIFLR